jgi:DNA sulfur modification protein DndE
MKFKPSLAAEEFITDIHQRVGARNKAVLGRSALFLALGEGVPPDFKSLDSQGKDLDDETVIGDELHDVVHAALNHRMSKELDETGYRQAFRLHFEYGCRRLKDIWADCGNDQVKFVTELLKLAGDLKPGEGPKKAPLTLPIVETEVKLKVLVDAPEWSLNGPGTNNGLLVISGQPGIGKSQLALDLLAQLANSGVRFVFFDMKGELEDDPNDAQQRQNRTRFLGQTGARHIRLIQQSLPINPLSRHLNPDADAEAQIARAAYEVANLIRCFAPQLGSKQERNIADAYEHLTSPDFRSLEQELVNTGANGVDLAIIQKIERLHLFANADTAISAQEWLSGSLVIDFKEFGNDTETKALAVALTLNFLMKELNQNLGVKKGIQPLKMVLFVDEAHLLLPKESKAGLLSDLARQGRSWGFPVWLASQDADKFLTTGTHETNFAELAECGVHFSPQTLNDSDQKMILGGIIHQKFDKGEAVLRLQGKLITGPARQFWRDGGR